MNKIITKLIKDCLIGKDLADYGLDFNNNIIMYKNCALYRADLSFLNKEFFINKKRCNIKNDDTWLDIIYNKHGDFWQRLNQETSHTNKKAVYISSDNTFTTFVDKKFLSLIDIKEVKVVMTKNNKTIIYYLNDIGEPIAAILPLIRKYKNE